MQQEVNQTAKGRKPTIDILSSSHNLLDFHHLDPLRVEFRSLSFDHIDAVVAAAVVKE